MKGVDEGIVPLTEVKQPIFAIPDFGLNGQLAAPIGAGWDLVTVNDVNGDSLPDYVWFNVGTSALVVWETDASGNIVAGQSVGEAQVKPGTPIGSADMNGDGNADILWRDGNSIVFWELDKGVFVESIAAKDTVPDDFFFVGFGQFDGKSGQDLLWRSNQREVAVIWQMDKEFAVETKVLSSKPTEDWSGVAIADSNNDGFDDIYWQIGESVGHWQIENSKIARNDFVLDFLNGPSKTKIESGDLNWELLEGSDARKG